MTGFGQRKCPLSSNCISSNQYAACASLLSGEVNYSLLWPYIKELAIFWIAVSNIPVFIEFYCYNVIENHC